MNTVFFDLDGTLTDPGEGITNSVRNALKVYGFEGMTKESLYPFIGPPLADCFQKYYGLTPEESQEAIVHFRAYFSTKGIFENEVYEGIPEMLCALKKAGKQIVLCTSKPEEFARRILEHFHLTEYFDQICGAAMDEKSRVHKDDVLRYALEKSGADPKKSVMVGDRRFDMESGKKFGLGTLGVSYGYGSREELSSAGADRICDTVENCKEILLQW